MLEGFLDVQRGTLLEKCMDLTAEQVGARSEAIPRLSLHGLVRHMARAERWWFRISMCGMNLPTLFATHQATDPAFDEVDPVRWEDDLETYRGEVAAASDAVAWLALDDLAKSDFDQPLSLRWIYLHMITEYARHNGQADLLREVAERHTGV